MDNSIVHGYHCDTHRTALGIGEEVYEEVWHIVVLTDKTTERWDT